MHKDPKNSNYLEPEFSGITHLLIDLDGTLLDSSSSKMILKFFKLVAPEFRHYGSWSQTAHALWSIHAALKKDQAAASTKFTNLKRTAIAFASVMHISEQEAEVFLSELIARVFPQLESYFYPSTDAYPFVEWANSRFHLSLATDPVWTKEVILNRLKWSTIPESWFHFVTHAGLMHAAKPSLEYYNELLDLIEVSPKKCLFIGNSFASDLPAVRAGIPTWIIRSTINTQPKPIKFTGQPVPAWCGSFGLLKEALHAKRA